MSFGDNFFAGLFTSLGSGGTSPQSTQDPGDSGAPTLGFNIFTETQIDDTVNPLSAYTDVMYSVELAMLPAPAASQKGSAQAPAPAGVSPLSAKDIIDNSYQMYEAGGDKRVVFAKTGGHQGLTYLNISGVTISNVTAVSSANPDLAQVVEMSVEIQEPAGASFDFWIRKAAGDLGYVGVSPWRCIWRLAISWSGYGPDGRWVSRIPFKTKTGKELPGSEIVYHCHISNLDTSVKPSGCTYTATLVPASMAAMQREVNISQVIQIECENNIQAFITDLTAKVNDRFRKDQLFHTIEIRLPSEKFGAGKIVDTTDLKKVNTSQLLNLEGTKVKGTLPPGNGITSMIRNGLAGVSMDGLVQEVQGDVGVVITIKPDVDYSNAKPNATFNDYTGINFIYNIEPFYQWRFLKAKASTSPSSPAGNAEAIARGAKAKKYGLVRRYYDYTWTSTNTEVLSLDLKTKMVWFADLGSPPTEEGPVHGGPQSTTDSPRGTKDAARSLNAEGSARVDGGAAARALQGGAPGSKTAAGANAVPHMSMLEMGVTKHGRQQPADNHRLLQAGGNRTQSATLKFGDYQQQFERMIGADVMQIDGMRVRGDPRWLVNYGQYATSDKEAAKWSRMSSLIRLTVKAPNQSEYMGSDFSQRADDLSYGGYYELIRIDTRLERGTFVQTLAGYRLFNMLDG